MVTEVGLPPIPKEAETPKAENTMRRPVYVEWVDSSGRRGWCDPRETYIPLMNCQTLGWLVEERDDSITVALNGVFDGTSSAPFGHLVCIPKCAIKHWIFIPV